MKEARGSDVLRVHLRAVVPQYTRQQTVQGKNIANENLHAIIDYSPI